jgi:hypothetical protein
MDGEPFDLDDDESENGQQRRFREFDCELCGANNPCDEFGDGDEVLCFYCGQEFGVRVSTDGVLTMREL